MMKKTEKLYNTNDVAKGIYKTILKSLKDKRRKEQTDQVVRDILDPNFVAQVDPDDIPNEKAKVLYKGNKEKGVDKLKKFLGKCKTCGKTKPGLCECGVKKDEPIPGLSE